MTATTKAPKTQRQRQVMTFRASATERLLIRRAAKARKFDNESAYVRDRLMTQVQMDLTERTEFEFEGAPDKMKHFLAALDRPVQSKPRLKKLLSEKSALE